MDVNRQILSQKNASSTLQEPTIMVIPIAGDPLAIRLIGCGSKACRITPFCSVSGSRTDLSGALQASVGEQVVDGVDP